MSMHYDNWERLVEAVLRRELLRQLSLDSSRSPSTRSSDSDFSWYDDMYFRPTPSPLHPDAVKLKLASSAKDGKQSGSIKEPRKRRNLWKGLSIFRSFSSKKDYGKEEREVQWARPQRTFHGGETSVSLFSEKHKYKEVCQKAGEAEKRVELARLRELHTLKGHIESMLKTKGLDMDSIHHYYTI